MIDAFAGGFIDWFGAIVFQATAILVLVHLVDRVVAGRISPRVRMALYAAAFLRLALPPGFASPVAAMPVHSTGDVPAPAIGFEIGPLRWMALAWVLGVVLFGVRSLRRERMARRLVLESAREAPASLRRLGASAAETLGLRRVPRIVISPAHGSAAVIGLLRPIVVVGARPLERLRAAELEHVLLHEFAHVRRRDALQRAVVGALVVLWWFHPLVWAAARRIAGLRELCCDATVADVLGDRTPQYRDTLVRAARGLLSNQPVAMLGLVRGDGVLARIRHLDREPWRRSGLSRGAALAAAVVLCACVLPDRPWQDDIRPVLRSAVDAEHVQNATDIVAAAVAGERPGCIRLKYAMLTLAADAAERGQSFPEERDDR